MAMTLRTSPATAMEVGKLNRSGGGGGGSPLNVNSCLVFANGYSSFFPYPSQNLSLGLRTTTKSVIVAAAAKKEDNKKKKKNKKADSHSAVPKPDESTGPFPEAVLLKQKKVQEDGRLLPEFADDDERELFESLNLKLESDLNIELMRHYEVVYLIHEDYAEEVGSVNSKVEDFLREKKGTIWRFSDWGLRRLAYKIKKAKNAHYILMNFELEAKWINEFKSMLDKDERVIRHLVIKRDEAITEDCPPPPEFHTLRADMDDDDGDDDEDDIDDEEEYDDEEEEDEDGEVDNTSNGVIYVEDDDEDDKDGKNQKTHSGSSVWRRRMKAEKVGSSR